jgi:hypothetical protein
MHTNGAFTSPKKRPIGGICLALRQVVREDYSDSPRIMIGRL